MFDLWGGVRSVNPSVAVRARHIDAGGSLIRLFEEWRVEQGKQHKEIIAMMKDVEKEQKKADAAAKRWLQVEVHAPKLVDEVGKLRKALEGSLLALQHLQEQVPQIEQALTALEKKKQAQEVVEWNLAAEKQVREEEEKVAANYDQRVKTALQDAFEEQLRRFKETGVVDMPASGIKPKPIEEVVLPEDNEEKEELDKFLLEEPREEEEEEDGLE